MARAGVQLVAFFLDTESKFICWSLDFGLTYHDGKMSVLPLIETDCIPAGFVNQSFGFHEPSFSNISLCANFWTSMVTFALPVLDKILPMARGSLRPVHIPTAI